MKSNLKLIGGQRIESPKSNITRPTTLMVRESLFNILRSKVINSNWLDLFCGTGSVSCEAINHGAKKIVAIEKNKINADICLRNISSLKQVKGRLNDVEVIRKDAINWIKSDNLISKSRIINSKEFEFDYVYVDPPYESKYYSLVLNLLKNKEFIGKHTNIICEHSKFINIQICDYWKIKDEREYGQTKITFLVKI